MDTKKIVKIQLWTQTLLSSPAITISTKKERQREREERKEEEEEERHQFPHSYHTQALSSSLKIKVP
jgi:hypothetical protein